MWNYLCRLWRSVFRAPADPGGNPEDVRNQYRACCEERARLRRVIASFKEFGYDDMALRSRIDLTEIERRISALRQRMRRQEQSSPA